jgi:hypothetical protein
MRKPPLVISVLTVRAKIKSRKRKDPYGVGRGECLFIANWIFFVACKAKLKYSDKTLKYKISWFRQLLGYSFGDWVCLWLYQENQSP